MLGAKNEFIFKLVNKYGIILRTFEITCNFSAKENVKSTLDSQH